MEILGEVEGSNDGETDVLGREVAVGTIEGKSVGGIDGVYDGKADMDGVEVGILVERPCNGNVH